MNLARTIKSLAGIIGVPLYTKEDIENNLRGWINQRPLESTYVNVFQSSYYQKLHEDEVLFQANNWLMDELSVFKALGLKTLLELGCGNGKFAINIAPSFQEVIAVDWAKSPLLTDLPENVRFMQLDVASDDLPRADITCSADFLEHLPPERLGDVIRKIIQTSPSGFHKIACYDDGHSHLSILPPWRWLEIFRSFDSSYNLSKVELRRGNMNQIVLVVSNLK